MELELRELMAASIGPISNVTAMQFVGYQVPVQGGAGAPNQVYTVTTDNTNVQASVAQGPFLTMHVSHESSGVGDPAFSGNLVFQLFQDLTPLTVSKITQLVEGGFYNGRIFHRVASGFAPAGSTNPQQGFIVQGGSVTGDGSGDLGLPGFPFQDEFSPRVAFTNPGQLAMANAGRDTNSSQFFITTSNPDFLDYIHTIFGQLVEGQNILTDMTMVARDQSDKPVKPITITSASLSNQSPDAVIHLSTNFAQPARFTHVTVTATDPVTHTSASQTFQVSVIPYVSPERNASGPLANPPRPILAPILNQNPVIGPNQTFTYQLVGADANPLDPLNYLVKGAVSTDQTGNQTFSPVQNASATVSPTGLVTVTPNKDFTGDIPLVVAVHDNTLHNIPGTNTPVPTLSDPRNTDYHKITLHVSDQVPDVRLVNRVLVVTAPARTDKGTNVISIEQATAGNLVVQVNGTVSALQPKASDIDSIVVYGSKANDQINVSPNVDSALPVLLDGGHGGFNFLKAGSGPTREHGWFGFNTMQGGPADDSLIGGFRHVHFVQSGGNDTLFAGILPPLQHRSTHHRLVRIHRFQPPGGIFYRFVGDRLVPIHPSSGHAQTRTTTSTTPTGTALGTSTTAASTATPQQTAAALRAARAGTVKKV